MLFPAINRPPVQPFRQLQHPQAWSFQGNRADQVASKADESAQPEPAPPVLIVEDDAGMQVMLAMALEDAGYTVYQASNGAEALDLLTTIQPRLILLDMRMPVMDGPTFVRRLQTRYQRAAPPIIAMTAYRDIDPEIQALGIPWLSKPMRLDALLSMIQQSLESN